MVNKNNIIDYELIQYDSVANGFINTNSNSIFICTLIQCIDNAVLFDEDTINKIINDLNKYDRY